MSENRLNSQDNQLRRMQGQGDQLEQMQAQIDALRSENSNMASEGTRVLSAYDDENRQLKEQLAAAQASSRPSAGPTALYGRSEEHTSELQSLMRISYAVFGLKT